MNQLCFKMEVAKHQVSFWKAKGCNTQDINSRFSRKKTQLLSLDSSRGAPRRIRAKRLVFRSRRSDHRGELLEIDLEALGVESFPSASSSLQGDVSLFFGRMETILIGKHNEKRDGWRKLVPKFGEHVHLSLLLQYINENYKQPLRSQPTNPIVGWKHLVEAKSLNHGVCSVKCVFVDTCGYLIVLVWMCGRQHGTKQTHIHTHIYIYIYKIYRTYKIKIS